jgi:FtsP/CotA-like multicopper oxidase with cupredoxin domain
MTDLASSRPDEAKALSAAGEAALTGPEFDAPRLGHRVLAPFLDGISGLRPHFLEREQTLSLSRTRVHFHRNLPALEAWGYGLERGLASAPGPLLEVDADHPSEVTWRNRIGPPGPLPFTAWSTNQENPPDSPQNYLGIDDESAGAPRDLSLAPVGWAVTHLHGGHTIPDSDGWPDDIMAGEGRQVCWYDNTSDNADVGLAKVGAMQWYHDHAMGATGLHVYAGLAGPYIIRSARERELGLPTSPATGESVLMIADRNLVEEPDGHIRFLHKNTPDTAEFFGPLTAVNGTLWPYLRVGAGVVRLRLYNASNSRAYRLHILDGHQQPLPSSNAFLIGTDAGLLRHARPLDLAAGLTLAPAERVDLLLDLAGREGTHLYVVNSAEAPFDNNPPPTDLVAPHRDLRLPYPQVMRLDVDRHRPVAPRPTLWAEISDAVLNPAFRRLVHPDTDPPASAPAADAPPVLTLPEDHGHHAVLLVEDPPGHLQLVEIDKDPAGRIRMQLPGDSAVTTYSPISAMSGTQMGSFYQQIGVFAAVGRWEVFRFLNTTVDVHPIHIHQSTFQPLGDHAGSYDTTGFDPDSLSTATDMISDGLGRSYDPHELLGWKDTIRVDPGQLVSVAIRFDIPGKYVYHCHILEHEDNEMMRPFIVSPVATSMTGHMP